MTRFGLDSVGHIPPVAHHAAGSTCALRYLSRSTSKVITRAEHEAYKANGIDLVLVFEGMGRPDRQTYADGKADAEYALRQALSILGTPHRPPKIRFAADYDPAGHPERADEAFDGIAAVIPRADCGPYGNDQMLAHQAARGFQTLWQTYGWSGGRFFSNPHNSVYQYSNGHVIAGIDADYNHLYGDDFGQYDYRPAPPPHPRHYERLTDESYAWKGRLLPHERRTAMRYDGLRAHPHDPRHRKELAQTRADLKDLADHVYFEAHKNGQGVWGAGANWGAFWRWWRYPALIHRARDARLV